MVILHVRLNAHDFKGRLTCTIFSRLNAVDSVSGCETVRVGGAIHGDRPPCLSIDHRSHFVSRSESPEHRGI